MAMGNNMEAKDVVGLEHIDYARPRPAPTGLEGNNLDDASRRLFRAHPHLDLVVLTSSPDLITQYHSLNSPRVTELQEDPSPLEYMRHVASNRPFVVRGGASSWKACKTWNSDYFDDIMGTHAVQIASTPFGNADSVLPLDGDGEKMIFVKPYETTDQFCSVMRDIQRQERNARKGNNPPTIINYLQTQNDNLRNECSPLEHDVPRDIPFARIALQKRPDAVNFWLGNSLSTTALHKDNYENIYVQVLGQKHFVLLPPVESPCVNERGILAATYMSETAPSSPPGASRLQSDSRLHPFVDDPITYTPFPTWDPDVPHENATRFSSLSQPLHVTLNPGDMLYLPALWYHKVSQTCNDEHLCCAVNYWYDLDFGGGFWSMSNFIRGVGLLPPAGEDDRDREEKRRGSDGLMEVT